MSMHVTAYSFDCVLVADGWVEIKKLIAPWQYGVLTDQNIKLAIDHLFNACCRWDLWWQFDQQLCKSITTTVWPKSMYLFDQLIAVGFEKLTSLRWDQPLFEGLHRSDYDVQATKRFDIVKENMVKYDGVLPEVLAQQFEDYWKVDMLMPVFLDQSCIHDIPVDVGLAGKHYNVCDVASCLMNDLHIRPLLVKQWIYNQWSNRLYAQCRSQANDLILKHIQQVYAVITSKAFSYQYNNRFTYINELIGIQTIPTIIETINGVTSDLSMVMQVTHPRAAQCFGNE